MHVAEIMNGAGRQNTDSCFSILWGKLISQRCVGDILSDEINGRRRYAKACNG
jgi:hypothetical protein